MCSTWFPRRSLPADVSLPSTGSSGSSSPASPVLSKRYDFVPPIPPHFVAFAWRYLSVHSLFRSSADECAAEAWSWSPGLSRRYCTEETTRSLKFLRNLNCPFAHVQSTPAGSMTPDHYGVATWRLVIERQGLPHWGFRSSIAWLSDSLPTLRRPGYPDTTQDSLPAAGQALPGGLSTRKIPMKSFRVVSDISFPFLRFLDAIDPAGVTKI